MALEHCDNPFLELKELYRSLKANGKICIVVPCDNIKYKYNEATIDQGCRKFYTLEERVQMSCM